LFLLSRMCLILSVLPSSLHFLLVIFGLIVVAQVKGDMVKMCLFYPNPSGHARTDPIISQTCASDHVHTVSSLFSSKNMDSCYLLNNKSFLSLDADMNIIFICSRTNAFITIVLFIIILSLNNLLLLLLHSSMDQTISIQIQHTRIFVIVHLTRVQLLSLRISHSTG
jgi:hypothetical protein